MYALILRHETRGLTRTPAFAFILVLLAAAMTFGAWSAAQTLGREHRGAQAVVAAADKQRGKLARDVAGYERKIAASGGVYEVAAFNHGGGAIPAGTNAGTVGSTAVAPAILPQTGLSTFAVGQSDIQLSYIPVTSNSIITVTRDSELGNPVNLKRGAFDISFVVIFLLPIFILAISYDMLSSEKERGTLAMVLSHPISLRKLMLSKMLSRAAIILAVVLAAGFGSLLAVGSNLSSPDTWIRFGLWLSATLLYSMFWFGLAVLVNSISKNSSTNGVVLAGSWLVLVVVAPTLVSVLATTTYPAPSRFEFITQSRVVQTEVEKEYMKALDKYYYDHAEFAPKSGGEADFLATSLAKNDAVEKAMMPLYNKFRSQLAKQDEMVASFQFVSPAIMMQRTLNDVSGASAARYAHFIDQVIEFRGVWTKYFTSRFLAEKALRSADYRRFPKFEYREEPVSAVIGRTAPSLIGLFALMSVVLGAAFAALRRYQVASR
ncbi:MAG: ABC transporter permease subunit [Pseudomonadota bacterium]|uniref:ABC transporter permease subunit n=1 Tax=Phenylobacterium sp. TaxID=1871053 RepID=UPI0025E7F395|nr:ABC transporter permease subunit [Phenylobacterium sp.]MBT9470565.1 ABC transporter permease subunit [Phenylobacterium sp.]